MRVKKYLALTLAAVLATTMLTACPWDQEEDKTDDASSVPVTSTDTSQDDDDHDSGDDDSQPTKPTLTLNGQTITVGQTSEKINVENGAYTVALTQSGGTDGTLTMTIETQPTENYVTNSVTANVDGTSVSWTRDTATRARTLSVRTDTKLSLTTNDEGKTFTLTGIPSNATSCDITVEFKDPGYTIAENGAYMVHNADGLLAWNEAAQKDPSLSCTLTVDINLEGKNWTPIGNSYSNAYAGTFDGGGYTISGLKVSGGDYVGLFGYVNGGTVQNVYLEIASISGNYFVGGIAGCNNGTIQGCMVSGGVSGNDLVGGVVGRNDDTVEGCCFAGSGSSVTAFDSGAWVGGVVGYNINGTVEGCCFAGDSVSGGSAVGGVVGYSDDGDITDCYWQAGQDGSPSQGVGNDKGEGNCHKVEDGNWTDAIDAMNNYLTGYQYELKGDQIVLVADNSNTPEVSGLTQRVLDVARAVGL